MTPAFSGIWTAMVTPFCDGAIDFAGLRRLAQHLRQAGVAGLVVCGTTGEAAALADWEQLTVLDAVMAAVPGFPVMMGLAGNNFEAMQVQLQHFNARRLAGVLVPAPYYIRPSQAGLRAFFRALADQSAAPIVLYNIPYRTGVTMEFDTIVALAMHPNIVAIKDCSGDPGLRTQLLAGGQLALLAGEDGQILSALQSGARGAISAAANVCPAELVAVATAVQSGRIDEARLRFDRLQELIGLVFEEPNPAPAKTALSLLGLIEDEVRFPLLATSPALRERLGRALDTLAG